MALSSLEAKSKRAVEAVVMVYKEKDNSLGPHCPAMWPHISDLTSTWTHFPPLQKAMRNYPIFVTPSLGNKTPSYSKKQKWMIFLSRL